VVRRPHSEHGIDDKYPIGSRYRATICIKFFEGLNFNPKKKRQNKELQLFGVAFIRSPERLAVSRAGNEFTDKEPRVTERHDTIDHPA
jgi:hypothetical protein